ncbi:MAG TPA: acyltransferase [Nocardioidaceae bacterium]
MQATGERWRLGHRPALDGLRGVAILLVLASHARIPHLYGAGSAGVSVFFALSGFLITTLLLEEHARTGRVDLRRFYGRRARRLFPALAVSVAVTTVVGPLLGAGLFSWSAVAAVVLYVGNWVQAFGGYLGWFAGTWSLAVEEQFYLLWPLALLLSVKRGPRAVLVVAGTGVVASLGVRVVLLGDSDLGRIYFGSDTSAAGLLVGCAVAALMHMSRPGRPLPWLATTACVLAGALGLAQGNAVAWGLIPAVVPFLAVLAIWSVARGDEPASWLSASWLVWVGRRSYGLYLWNCLVNVYLTFEQPHMAWPLHAAVLVGVSLPLTVLSWRYVESPFLRRQRGTTLKRRMLSDPFGESVNMQPTPMRSGVPAHVHAVDHVSSDQPPLVR